MTMDAAALLRAFAEALLSAAETISIDVPRASLVESASSDRWLTPSEAAQRMGVTVRWITRRWRSLPFCYALPQGRGYRVSANGLARAMQQRR